MNVFSCLKSKPIVKLEHLNILTVGFSTSSSTTSTISKPTFSHFLNSTTITETLSKLLNQNSKLPQINQIHCQIITQSLSRNSSLISTLIRSYTFSKNLVFARNLFDRFPSPSPFTLLWNIMIQAYSKIPNSQESLNLFHQMLSLDQPSLSIPDKYTYTFIITACSYQLLPMFGTTVHGRIIKVSCESDVFVGNSLLNMYSTFAKIDEARNVFDEMSQRDVVTWTSLISGYAKCGEMCRAEELFNNMPERNEVSWTVIISGCLGNERYSDALRYFNEMLCDNCRVKPNEAVLVCALSACARLGALDQGKWIHVYIDKSGLSLRSSNLSAALIDMYAKCGKIECAQSVFNGTSLRDVLTFTSMISGLSAYGLGKQALDVFSQMLVQGIKPNDITLLGVLNGCSHSGLVEEGRSVFNKMEVSWGVSPKIEHYGCMVDLLGRSGHLEQAFDVVKNMPMEPDIVIWRALLSACRVHGNVNLGEQIVDHISQLDPNVQSGGFVLLSNLYASFGRWDGVARLREEMNGKKKTIESSPGCSWIELDGVVHEFRPAERLHPQSREINEKLKEVMKIISVGGGYVANTKQVLFDLSEEDKEQALAWHSEKLAVAFGLLRTDSGTSILIVKNLRICEDCHSAMKAISQVFGRELIVRDRSRFHTFKEGKCSCKDYW